MDTRLIDLLQKYNSTDKALDENVRLYHDLNIYGDDAIELLNCFEEQFKVDLSRFRFTDYFPSEGDWILPSLFRFLTGKKPKEYKQLTLSDLNKAINIGYLE
ncbi:DUF1493 family protein [Sphingobacterium spiritivorum]|uniref:DUF1493 family protein n=1 Tax=Sphingobacterium spiritivorum TaxID=258 RepID=UPI003DA44A23